MEFIDRPERREFYRIDFAQTTRDVRVTVKTWPQGAIPAELVDLNRKGVAIRVQEDLAPRFAPGHEVTLIFNSPTLASSLCVPAYLRSIVQTPGQCRYGFEFDRHVELSSRLPRALVHIFNRRRAPRVRLDPPAQVRLCPHGTPPVTGSLRDLSWTGAAVTIPARQKCIDLERTDRVALEGEIDASLPELRIVGRVERSLVLDDELCYGISFDPELADNHRQLNLLRAYIARLLQQQNTAQRDR